MPAGDEDPQQAGRCEWGEPGLQMGNGEAAPSRLLAGRSIAPGDDSTNRVAVINQAMAKRFWPGESAVGKRFAFGGRPGTPTAVGRSPASSAV